MTQFAAAALTPGANPAPAIRIGSTNGTVDRVTDVAFDSTGNLIASISLGAHIDKQAILVYGPALLTASGNPTPSLIYVPPNGNGVTHVATAHHKK